MEAVTLKNAAVKYRIKFVVKGKESWEELWALNGISFSVDKGQALAIIGENGAGKSTILKLIVGSLKADKGEVFARGRVSGLLELGAGFHPELTGRENLYLSASLFGLSKSDTDSILNNIIEFSGLGRFIDAQVKSYSQGMFVRLAFSVAIHVNPDILLIDDSLSVGDEDFQKKCIQKILELKNERKTLIFVTHDLNMARRLCAKGIFLRSGEIIKEAAIDTVISYYMETLGDKKGIAIIQGDSLGAVFNNGRLIIHWEDKTITQDQGGYSSFFFGGHRFNSPAANWCVEIKNTQHIVAKGEWFNIPVAQIWNIRLVDNGQLQLKVGLEISDKTTVEGFQLELLFKEEYRNWFSSEQRGILPRNFFHEKECELVYNDPIDKLAGFKGNEKEYGPDSLPTVIVDAFGQQVATLCQIVNSGLDITARIIRLKSQVVYEVTEDGVDTGLSLAMKIKLIEGSQQDTLRKYLYNTRQLIEKERQRFKKEEMETQLKKFVFGKGRFSLSIDENNLLHMYYGGEKITGDYGIRTSLLIGNEWKDTYVRQMWIKKISENHIEVHNISWTDVPATQTWSFLMRKEGVIEVVMQMDMQSQISIHEIHASIFFSQAYTRWLTFYESGNFSENLKAAEEVSLKDKNTRAVGVASASLPTIVLDLSRDLKYLLRIWNPELPSLSPMLEAITEDMECRKGKIDFFTGVIRITEDKNSINGETCEFSESRRETEEGIFDKEGPGGGSLYLVDGRGIDQQTPMLFTEPKNRLAEISRMYALKKVGIAVTRFNFFEIDKVLRFYAGILNKKVDLDNCVFNPFPVKTIFSNFIDYYKQLKLKAEAIGIRLVLKDRALPGLFKTFSRRATAYNGRQLLRFLGAVCEHAFIGPRQIVIDLYHRCNTNCVHCWFHNPKTTLPDEYLDMQLDFELYKKIVDDAQQLYVELIIFDGNGEPLLDQRFPKMAEYAKDKGIMISFSTNGILFGQGMAKKALFDFNVETITSSLPAATEETYALINPKQPKAVFNEVIRNMSYFIKLRNNAGLKKPFLQMNHVIHALNCHELMKMAELDAEIGADIVQFCVMQKPDKNIAHLALSPEQAEMIKHSLGRITDFLHQRNIALDESFLDQLKIYGVNSAATLKDVYGKRRCPIGWFQALVFANSEICMCQSKVVDSLARASFKEIWNSEKYNIYRIQAKYLKDNKEVVFMNGKKLYDENCEQCGIFRKASRID